MKLDELRAVRFAGRKIGDSQCQPPGCEADARNVEQGNPMSQPPKTRALHVRDRRVRREPVAPNAEPSEATETPAEPSASPTIPAAAVYDPTVEQPAAAPDTWAPLPPIRVHDEDLWSTAPMPTVPPTIDFPIDEARRS